METSKIIYKFTYYEHLGFADIASRDYYLIDGEEYVIFRAPSDYHSMYRGTRIFCYIRGNFFSRYNSEIVDMGIQLDEIKELTPIIEKTEIKWQSVVYP
jgi:hypothetical protein